MEWGGGGPLCTLAAAVFSPSTTGTQWSRNIPPSAALKPASPQAGEGGERLAGKALHCMERSSHLLVNDIPGSLHERERALPPLPLRAAGHPTGSQRPDKAEPTQNLSPPPTSGADLDQQFMDVGQPPTPRLGGFKAQGAEAKGRKTLTFQESWRERKKKRRFVAL